MSDTGSKIRHLTNTEVLMLGLISSVLVAVGYCGGVILHQQSGNLDYGRHKWITEPLDSLLRPPPADNNSMDAAVEVTHNLDIVIHIRSPEEVRQTCSPSLLGTAYACTAWARTPCQVYLPYQKIIYYPKQERAEFLDIFDGRVLAHEFMHCFYPRWHDIATKETANP